MDTVHPRADAQTSTRLAAAAFGAMLSIPFVLPAGIDPIPSFEAEWLAVVLGIVGLLAAGAGRHWAVPGVALLPLAFAGLILIQMAAGRLALVSHGWLGILYLFWAAALACAGAWVRVHARRDHIVVWLAWALVASALVNAFCAGVQVAGLFESGLVLPMTGSRAGGNLGQPNHLAAHLVLGAASAAYLAGAGQLGRAASAAVTIALALGLHWAGSRSGWPMLAVLLAGSFAIRPAVGAAAARVWRGQFAGLAAAWLVLDLVRMQLPGASGAAPAAFRLIGDAGSLVERLRIWEGALGMFRESPFAGVGYGRFAESFLARAPGLTPPVPATMTAHAHSLPLQVAAEFGLIGLVVLLGCAGAWFLQARRGRPVPESAWALAVAGTLGVHALVEYPLWFAYFLGPFAFALGLAEGARLEFRIARAGRMAMGGVGLAAAVLLLTIALDYRVIRGFAEGEVARLDAATREARVRSLSDLRFQSLLAGYADVGLHRGLSLTPAYLPEKLALSGETVRMFPLPDVAFRHAMLLAMGGDSTGAALWWDRAVAAYPSHAGGWLATGRALGLAGPWAGLAATLNFGDDS